MRSTLTRKAAGRPRASLAILDRRRSSTQAAAIVLLLALLFAAAILVALRPQPLVAPNQAAVEGGL